MNKLSLSHRHQGEHTGRSTEEKNSTGTRGQQLPTPLSPSPSPRARNIKSPSFPMSLRYPQPCSWLPVMFQCWAFLSGGR